MCGGGGGGAGEEGAPPLGFRTPAGRAKTPVEATETLSEVTKSVRKQSKEHVRAVGAPLTRAQGRGSRGGGGSGGNLPAQLWTVNVVIFYFCLFLHMNLGLTQKTVGQIRGVFNFG